MDAGELGIPVPKGSLGMSMRLGVCRRPGIRDQGTSVEAGGSGPSWDHAQVSWGHVWAGVLGWGPWLQLTLAVGSPPGQGGARAWWVSSRGWAIWATHLASSRPCWRRPATWQSGPECIGGGRSPLRTQPHSGCGHCPGQGRPELPPSLLLPLGYTLPNQAALKGLMPGCPPHPATASVLVAHALGSPLLPCPAPPLAPSELPSAGRQLLLPDAFAGSFSAWVFCLASQAPVCPALLWPLTFR